MTAHAVITSYLLLLVLLSAACRPEQAAAVTEPPLVSWDFRDGPLDWNGLNDCRLAVVDQILSIVNTGHDPHFTLPIKTLTSGEPRGWMELTIRAQFQGTRRAEVFWSTESDPVPSARRSARFKMRSRSSGWQDYKVRFHATSPLVAIRLDLDDRPSQMKIERIWLNATAAPVSTATEPTGIEVASGFQVELLYSVPKETEGSWVSLAATPQGHLYASDQSGALYRIVVAQEETIVERVPLEVGSAQGMVWAFDSLYVVVNTPDQFESGLYRLQDTDADGELDQVELLLPLSFMNFGSEHGPHGIVAGPDGKSLYLVAGNMTRLPENLVEPTRCKSWGEDLLLLRNPSSNGFGTGFHAPAGWVCRINLEGKEPEEKRWELLSVGLRNPYDLAFNRQGELFTFDSDMEFDAGTPWYQPTRITHVVSGGEYGWRYGTGKWPAYFPDRLPSVVDIGLSSPTGVAFGYDARFPAKYREALFACDWTYGRMFAVHLVPRGASYTATYETFLRGSPLALTDVVVSPTDGAMYFITGGRGIQSGLYRVTYVGAGDEPDDSAPVELGSDDTDATNSRSQRHRLESLQRPGGSESVEEAWQSLGHADRSIRFAARVALEHQDVSLWSERALAEEEPETAIQSLVALARLGSKSQQPQLLAALDRVEAMELSVRQRIDLLRAYGLSFIRMGPPAGATRLSLIKRLDTRFPSHDKLLDRELCRLLAYLDAESAVPKGIDRLDAATLQEDQLFYLLVLRNVQNGWTLPLRRKYFDWLNTLETKAARGEVLGGGHLQAFLRRFRRDAVQHLSEDERQALHAELNPGGAQLALEQSPTPREFVRNWTVADLSDVINETDHDRFYENGKELFTAVSCIQCHRFNNAGGIFGPDLTGVGKRFDRAALLRELIEPSKVVSDQYQLQIVVDDSGVTHLGRIIGQTDKHLTIATDPREPSHVVQIPTDEILETAPSTTSMMPTALLNTLTRDDILDLLAYLESGGDPQHKSFATSTGPSP